MIYHRTFSSRAKPYVDAFAGRIISIFLDKRYFDYTPGRLKERYDEAGITVRQ